MYVISGSCVNRPPKCNTNDDVTCYRVKARWTLTGLRGSRHKTVRLCEQKNNPWMIIVKHLVVNHTNVFSSDVIIMYVHGSYVCWLNRTRKLFSFDAHSKCYELCSIIIIHTAAIMYMYVSWLIWWKSNFISFLKAVPQLHDCIHVCNIGLIWWKSYFHLMFNFLHVDKTPLHVFMVNVNIFISSCQTYMKLKRKLLPYVIFAFALVCIIESCSLKLAKI